MARKNDDKGFTCRCGERHEFPAYVYAHWDMTLTHTCDNCGRRHEVIAGVASEIKGLHPEGDDVAATS